MLSLYIVPNSITTHLLNQFDLYGILNTIFCQYFFNKRYIKYYITRFADKQYDIIGIL